MPTLASKVCGNCHSFSKDAHMAYDDPYYDEYGGYWQEQDPTPSAPTTDFYQGGVVLAGWTPNGLGEWEPIYQGNDGRYYIKGGSNGQSGWVPWSGMPSNLKTGTGDGGKPTWNPGDPEPSSAGQTYQESVQAANVAPAASAAPSGGSASRTLAGSPQLGSLLKPYGKTFTPSADAQYGRFTMPTTADMLNDPGYQFRMDQGRKALEASAAAKGVLRTGGTLKDLLDYGQQFGANEFQNVFNRNLSTYNVNADRAKEYWNRDFDVFNNDWKMWDAQNRNVFDRLKWQTEFGRDTAAM